MKHIKGLILLLALCRCVPDFGDPVSLLSGSRILAIRSEPAEVFPGEPVQLQLYAADPSGALSDQTVDWALCTASKPPVENRPISEACLDEGALPVLDTAQTVSVVIPDDACARFGPELPPSGDAEARPRDPDVTGGYYQPVRAKLGSLWAVGLVRIRCGVAGSTPEVSAQFRREYVPNRNPFASTLWAEKDGARIPLSALPTDSAVTLKLGTVDGAQESFVRFDVQRHALTVSQEALRVSWLSAQGKFSVAATSVLDGVGQVEWQAPSMPGAVLLWTVLRDSRGGVSVQSYSIEVRSR
jgi:hypothetical protein